MNSFYGGREGAPFIIRKSYKDVPAMIDDFGKGLNNTEVKFGEFIIINTDDKNHPDNGKIFRRNFMGGNIEYYNAGKDEKGNYIKTAEVKNGNGAELIGTVVGPAGAAPHFQPVPFTTEELKFNEQGEPELDEEGNQIKEEKTYTLEALMEKYSAYDTTSGSGSFEIPKGNLIPGKNGDVFKDDITWTSYSVRTPNADDTTAFIDFQMPYDVIEFDASTVNAYYHRDNETADFENLNLVDRHIDDKGEHPFYQKWQINIPKGIKGQSIKNIRVIEATDEVKDFVLDEKGYIIRTEEGRLTVKEYDGQQDDIDYKRKIIVCDVVDYDRVLEGDEYIIYLGDYNMIDNIVLENDGKLTIEYSHNNDDVRKGNDRLTWIKSSSYNKETGLLSIDLNNDVEGRQQETRIEMKCAADLLVEDGNKLVLQYNTETEGVKHIKDLGRFIYQGETQPDDLIVGGLWIETIKI